MTSKFRHPLIGQNGKCPFSGASNNTSHPLSREPAIESIEMVRPIGFSGFHGFYRLITNPNAEPFCGRITIPRSIFFGEAMIRVMEYLRKVATGDGSRAYCPFVGGIERRNGYYAAIFDPVNNPNEQFVLSIIDLLLIAGYTQLSRPEFRDQTTSYTAFIAAFAHCYTQEFSIMLERMHASNRLRFLNEGLMIGYMHPHHPLGGRDGKGGESMFVSEIPILVVRKMDRSDHVFMTTPETKAAYKRYFEPLEHSGEIQVEKDESDDLK